MNVVPTSGMTALSIGKGISLNSAGELEATLRQIGATRYHSLHPFHRLLHGGKLNKGQVQAWALNRYYYQARIPVKDATLIARLPTPELRRAWRRRLHDHDGDEPNTGGIARWSNERGLIPQLGAFVGQESRIPYDYNDLIATVAPRPVYVFDPIYDRDSTPADVKAAVEDARKAYTTSGATDKLVLDQPWDYFRLSLEAQDRIVEWMTKNMH